MINFQIKQTRTVAHLPEYIAERPNGELLATISPRLMPSMKYSDRFLNVCTMDGKVEIADGLDHASEIIATKFFH